MTRDLRLVVITHILCVCVYVEIFWLSLIFSVKHVLLFLIKTGFFILKIIQVSKTFKTH